MAKHRWIIGMGLNMIGSIFLNFGTNLIKKSHLLKSQPSKLILNIQQYAILWWFGIFFFFLGSALTFSSFSMASQSLLSSLGGIQFISNVFFAYLILNEKPTMLIIQGTVIILFGLLLTVCFSNHSDHSYSIVELISFYDSFYIRFLILEVLFLVGCECIYKYFTQRENQNSPLPFSSFIRPISYSLVSALVGSQSILQIKCLSELMKTHMSPSLALDPHSNHAYRLDFSHSPVTTSGVVLGDEGSEGGGEAGLASAALPSFLLAASVAVVLGLSFWMYRMNHALSLFDGLVIIPTLQICWTLSAIAQGGVYFQEFQRFSMGQGMGFGLGVSLMVLGALLLSQPRPSTEPTDPILSQSKETELSTSPSSPVPSLTPV